MIRAVLFDAVGTLIHPRPAAIQVYHEVALRRGSRLTLPEIRQRFHAAFQADSLRDVAENFVTSPSIERARWHQIVMRTLDDLPCPQSDAAFDELWHHFALPSSWQLDEDLVEVWQQLKQAGYCVGIASNFDERLETVCAGLTPLEQANRIFYSAQLGHRKPSPRFFAAIERELDLQPHELLLIGNDAAADYDGARRAGWHAIKIEDD
ncbi:MAG: HAD-IA family hydrolase [Planctomycetales bacterium]|nr:HAD-IA family hydrolase [Planctomycetales bacterium]